MSITFRNYNSEPFFTEDYCKVREFLIRINADKLREFRLPWGAWEWAVTHRSLDQSNLKRIGLWEDEGKLVALATYESQLGEGFFIVGEAYGHLKSEMVAYAKKALHDSSKLQNTFA